MAVTLTIELGYEFGVKARFKEVFDLLSDVPLSASHFPGVEQLVDLGSNRYRWEMENLGSEVFKLQAVYASSYRFNRSKGSISWTPLAGVGNARVGGSWAVGNKKTHTELVLTLQAEVDLPLPALMQAVLQPVLTAEFERLVETYIERLIQRFGGEV